MNLNNVTIQGRTCNLVKRFRFPGKSIAMKNYGNEKVSTRSPPEELGFDKSSQMQVPVGIMVNCKRRRASVRIASNLNRVIGITQFSPYLLSSQSKEQRKTN